MPDSPAVLLSILFFIVIAFAAFSINLEKMFLQRKFKILEGRFY